VNRFSESFAVVLDEPDGVPDDRRRASVVHLEIDPSQARQRLRQGEDATDVREPPAVDRLAVNGLVAGSTRPAGANCLLNPTG
jgi:hypothetical protein